MSGITTTPSRQTAGAAAGVFHNITTALSIGANARVDRSRPTPRSTLTGTDKVRCWHLAKFFLRGPLATRPPRRTARPVATQI